MEESGRRESFAPTYGVHINPVSKGKQIPLCSSGQGCTHEGGPFQRPPIDCTDLNYRTLKTLFSIHHQHHSYTVGPNDKTRQPKIREINWSSLCLQQFWRNFGYEVHAMTGNGSYVNLLKLVLKNSWNHFSRRNYFWWVPFWNFVQQLWQLLYWSQYRKNLLRFLPKTDKKLQCYCSEKKIF